MEENARVWRNFQSYKKRKEKALSLRQCTRCVSCRLKSTQFCFTCTNSIDNRDIMHHYSSKPKVSIITQSFGDNGVTTASFRHVVCVWWSTSQFSFRRVKALLPRWIRQNGLTNFPYIISFTCQKFNLNATLLYYFNF